MHWLGLDVGGANLKIASCQGYARSEAFALWRRSDELASALRELISNAPHADGIAFTMSGELADCFETKTHGVLHILNAVEHAAAPREILVYGVDGSFSRVEKARSEPLLAAASNWHALARCACRWVERFPAVLVDVGSTTTDIVWLTPNGPNTSSTTDTQRLLAGELVYTGIERTNIAAITPVLPYRKLLCPIASEMFATAADAAVLLGFSPEQALNRNTADGRSLTKNCSHDRMARMFCADRSEFNYDDALTAARFVWKQQASKIGQALTQLADTAAEAPASFLLSGSGESLAEAAVTAEYSIASSLRLSTILRAELSRVAPAYAVALLASRQGSES